MLRAVGADKHQLMGLPQECCGQWGLINTNSWGTAGMLWAVVADKHKLMGLPHECCGQWGLINTNSWDYHRSVEDSGG